MSRNRKIDFAGVNRAALAALPSVLHKLLPGGMIIGNEYAARNPRRADHNIGSFKVNLRNGKWADFAVSGVAGGDVISLVAYIDDCPQAEAARRLARLLKLEVSHA
jgi:hypothetical protein